MTSKIPLSFEDVDGQRGYVTERLVVRYNGAWEDDPTRYVEHIEYKYRSGGSEFQQTNVYSQLVLEMPSIAPIVEVERTEDPYAKA